MSGVEAEGRGLRKGQGSRLGALPQGLLGWVHPCCCHHVGSAGYSRRPGQGRPTCLHPTPILRAHLSCIHDPSLLAGGVAAVSRL